MHAHALADFDAAPCYDPVVDCFSVATVITVITRLVGHGNTHGPRRTLAVIEQIRKSRSRNKTLHRIAIEDIGSVSAWGPGLSEGVILADSPTPSQTALIALRHEKSQSLAYLAAVRRRMQEVATRNPAFFTFSDTTGTVKWARREDAPALLARHRKQELQQRQRLEEEGARLTVFLGLDGRFGELQAEPQCTTPLASPVGHCKGADQGKGGAPSSSSSSSSPSNTSSSNGSARSIFGVFTVGSSISISSSSASTGTSTGRQLAFVSSPRFQFKSPLARQRVDRIMQQREDARRAVDPATATAGD